MVPIWQTEWYHIPEDHNIHRQCYRYLESHIKLKFKYVSWVLFLSLHATGNTRILPLAFHYVWKCTCIFKLCDFIKLIFLFCMLFLHLCITLYYLEIVLTTSVSLYILLTYEPHSHLHHSGIIILFQHLSFYLLVFKIPV